MKKIQPTWIHLLGTLIFVGILALFAVQVFIPRIFNKIEFDKYTLIQKPKSEYVKPNINYMANFTTSQGNFTVDLFESSAPQNVNNFIYLSDQGYYNKVYFHRLIPNLLVQSGDRNTLNSDPNDDGFGKTSYYINDELNWDSLHLSKEKITDLESKGYKSTPNISSHSLEKYSLAMAGNGPNTNSSQFFIVLADDNDTRLKELNGQFTVIGKVITGTDILDKINNIPVDDSTSNNPHPTTKIQIQQIKIATK